MEETQKNNSRRNFLKTAAVAAAAFTIVPRHVLGGKGFLAPSDKLYIAGVGSGGKGYSDLKSFHDTGKAVINFLCDVDDRRAQKAREDYPKAKYVKDWRELLDKEAKKHKSIYLYFHVLLHGILAFALFLRKISFGLHYF